MGLGIRSTVAVVVAALLFIHSCAAFIQHQAPSPAATDRYYTILHSTDVHGWIMGHRHNATLDADLGDLLSLSEHLEQEAQAAGHEFLMFDTGDIVEGTGLSDSTPIHGEDILGFYARIPYHARTMGNHDVGHPDTVDLFRNSFIPQLKGTYLTSNTFNLDGSSLGGQWSIVNTTLGSKVLVLGYIYDFTQGANNTVIHPVEKSVTEPYFAAAMAAAKSNDVNIFVVLMHIDPRSQNDQLSAIYNGIRAKFPFKPIVMLSGHAHMSVFKQYDADAFTLESGCYMNELGLIKFRTDALGRMADLQTQWIVGSRQEFYALTQTTATTFPTADGQKLSDDIHALFTKLALDTQIGCSPITYSSTAGLSDPTSLYSLWIEKIAPSVIFSPTMKNTQYLITNTAFLRYPLWEGPIIVDDTYATIPFTDGFAGFVGLTGTQLSAVLTSINRLSFKDIFRTTCREPLEGSYLPSWAHSSMTIDPTATYDLVCSDYDAVPLGNSIKTLFPTANIQQIVYPTTYLTHTALTAYIQKFMDTAC